MHITPKRAVRIYHNMSNNPRKQADLLHQWEAMAKGGLGPYVSGTHSKLRVRNHYYPKWTDDDFTWVLKQVTMSTDDTP